MADNLEILLVQAQLDEQLSTKMINEQLKRIQAKLDKLVLNISLDKTVIDTISKIADSTKNMSALITQQNEAYKKNIQIVTELDGSVKKIEQQFLKNGSIIEIVTERINKQKQAVQGEVDVVGKLAEELGLAEENMTKLTTRMNGQQKTTGQTSTYQDGYTTTNVRTNANGKVTSITEIENLKLEEQETQKLTQLQNDLLLKVKELAADGTLIKDEKLLDFTSQVNSASSLDEINKLTLAFKDLEAEHNKLYALDKAQYQAQQTDAKMTQQNLQKEQQAYADAIDAEMKQIKAFYDMKLTTAEQTLQSVEKLMSDETQYFIDNQDKRMQALKLANAAETQMNSQGTAKSTTSTQGSLPGFGIGSMATMMAEFAGMNALFSNIQEGFIGIDKASAKLAQTLPDQTKTQQQLNSVTNQFIDIAKQYGTSVNDVIQAGSLWTRQYKDLGVAQTLTRNATLLSIVDNMSVADSNKAVESSLQTMKMKVDDVGSAYASSAKLVDSWTAVSHNFSIQAVDVANGFERSSAAAHDAGLSIDQLNSLIAAGVRDSGKANCPLCA